MQIVIEIPDVIATYISEYDFDNARDIVKVFDAKITHAIRHGTPLPKGHGDLIDRKDLEICPIDITDLPTDKCLMVYLAEDIDNAPTIIEADKGEEECSLK